MDTYLMGHCALQVANGYSQTSAPKAHESKLRFQSHAHPQIPSSQECAEEDSALAEAKKVSHAAHKECHKNFVL